METQSTALLSLRNKARTTRERRIDEVRRAMLDTNFISRFFEEVVRLDESFRIGTDSTVFPLKYAVLIGLEMVTAQLAKVELAQASPLQVKKRLASSAATVSAILLQLGVEVEYGGSISCAVRWMANEMRRATNNMLCTHSTASQIESIANWQEALRGTRQSSPRKSSAELSIQLTDLLQIPAALVIGKTVKAGKEKLHTLLSRDELWEEVYEEMNGSTTPSRTEQLMIYEIFTAIHKGRGEQVPTVLPRLPLQLGRFLECRYHERIVENRIKGWVVAPGRVKSDIEALFSNLRIEVYLEVIAARAIKQLVVHGEVDFNKLIIHEVSWDRDILPLQGVINEKSGYVLARALIFRLFQELLPKKAKAVDLQAIIDRSIEDAAKAVAVFYGEKGFQEFLKRQTGSLSDIFQIGESGLRAMDPLEAYRLLTDDTATLKEIQLKGSPEFLKKKALESFRAEFMAAEAEEEGGYRQDLLLGNIQVNAKRFLISDSELLSLAIELRWSSLVVAILGDFPEQIEVGLAKLPTFFLESQFLKDWLFERGYDQYLDEKEYDEVIRKEREEASLTTELEKAQKSGRFPRALKLRCASELYLHHSVALEFLKLEEHVDGSEEVSDEQHDRYDQLREKLKENREYVLEHGAEKLLKKLNARHKPKRRNT